MPRNEGEFEKSIRASEIFLNISNRNGSKVKNSEYLKIKKELQKEGINDFFQDKIACPICGDMICRGRIKSHNTNSIC